MERSPKCRVERQCDENVCSVCRRRWDVKDDLDFECPFLGGRTEYAQMYPDFSPEVPE